MSPVTLMRAFEDDYIWCLRRGAAAWLVDFGDAAPAPEALPMETITLPQLDVQLANLAIAGHTADHVAYYGGKLRFCGHTLLADGRGRLFEDAPTQVWASLSKLASPRHRGHEHTLSNRRAAPGRGVRCPRRAGEPVFGPGSPACPASSIPIPVIRRTLLASLPHVHGLLPNGNMKFNK